MLLYKAAGDDVTGGRGDDCPFVDVTAGGRDVTMVIHFQLN